MRLVVSRIDLFADIQGWEVHGDERRNFVTRATARRTFEEGDAFTGLQFGNQVNGHRERTDLRQDTRHRADRCDFLAAYRRQARPGRSSHASGIGVHRGVLREFGLTTPDEVLDAAGSLCGLLHARVAHSARAHCDSTRSRWPLAPEWEAIHRASMGEGSIGITRAYKGQQRGEMGKSFPGLVGRLARFGALGDCYSQAEASLRSLATT